MWHLPSVSWLIPAPCILLFALRSTPDGNESNLHLFLYIPDWQYDLMKDEGYLTINSCDPDRCRPSHTKYFKFE